MKTFSKNVILYLFWCMALVVIVATLWFLFSREMAARPSSTALTLPPSDRITMHDLTQGNRLVTNATAHYAVILPLTWYLEKRAGSGLTVYPDYDPVKKNSPACKIDITLMKNSGNADLDEWLTNYLHADPTAEVIESSRMSSTISGHPAVTWHGSFNGISSTLAYISREDGLLYEVAPSLIEPGTMSGIPAPSPDTGDCFAAFQSLFSSFRILP